jgi:predicted RNA binding protein YcfA (HicA-like mRNA interferase family)
VKRPSSKNMGIKKNLKKLLSEPKEMRMDEVKNILHNIGFMLRNSNGSHYNFKHDRFGKLTIPSHGNKVKRWYLRRIKDIIMQNNLIEL